MHWQFDNDDHREEVLLDVAATTNTNNDDREAAAGGPEPAREEECVVDPPTLRRWEGQPWQGAGKMDTGGEEHNRNNIVWCASGI